MNALNVAFNKLGYTNGHNMPQTTKNTDAIAWELFIAQHIARIAEARKDEAHKEAVKAGVLFDHKSNPKDMGTHSIYTGDIVSYICKVNSPPSRLDTKMLRSELLKAGVSQEVVNKCYARSTKELAGAHSFVGTLVVNG